MYLSRQEGCACERSQLKGDYSLDRHGQRGKPLGAFGPVGGAMCWDGRQMAGSDQSHTGGNFGDVLSECQRSRACCSEELSFHFGCQAISTEAACS